MDVIGGLVLLALVGLGVRAVFRAAVEGWRAHGTRPGQPGAGDPSPAAVGSAASSYVDLVQDALDELGERYGFTAASRTQLLDDPTFAGAVEALEQAWRASGAPVEELVDLARDNRVWLSRIALAALARCDDVPETWPPAAGRRRPGAPGDPAGLLLASIEHAPGEVIGPVLAQLEEVLPADLLAFLHARIDGDHERFDAERMARHVPRSLRGQVQALCDEYGPSLPGPVRDACEEWLGGQIDLGPEASELVTVWSRPFAPAHVRLDAQRARVAEEIAETVTQPLGRSVVVVGEHGVGKTVVIRSALDLTGPEWTVFEAGAGRLNAGAMFIGQLEGRVEELVRRLAGMQAVWVFPAFDEALYAGAHMGNPTGLIDRLLPHVERGALRIVAEVSPAAYELLAARRPAVTSAFAALRLRPLDERETVALGRDVLAGLGLDRPAEAPVREAHEFAQQFLPGAAPPGNTLRLLEATAPRLLEEGRRELATSDVISTLSMLTGIPLAVLDPSQPLGLDRVRAFLEERVLGQPEAIDVLVDRIALVKSGLTDPTRPLGVFLFVGPTGTGKTELAKALAELLFGSPTRLVRLDMSEYQTPDALDRLLADANVEASASPLIAAVRRDPFSVILLDEFEKAAPPVRDLFLQLFDDGRLTDRGGRTTDFRRCVVIMTSNVGSALQAGPGLGFSGHVEPFRESDVERALRQTFRPELVNRIDRIVVFRPFGRAQLRALLDKELDDVVRRRGLRDRPWALEVDDSAVGFLLERGFTPDLGARPLKRAVEQYVLTPLARAIADAQVPRGDQFLFLTAAGDRLEVRFVGLEPDEPPEPGGVAAEETGSGQPPAGVDGTSPGVELRALARSGARAAEAPERLSALLAGIRARVDGEAALRKQLLLAEVSREGFWERGDRFAALAEAEYLDRLEAATRTAERLAERLAQATEPHARGEVAELLGSRLYVLERALAGIDAGAPYELFVRARPVPADASGDRDADAFLDRIVGMYRGWAERHGMAIRELAVPGGERLLAVGGLGAGAILPAEAGLHVLEPAEARDGGVEADRVVIGVGVAAAEPGEPVSAAELATRAVVALDRAGVPGHVTRRYRFDPTPLVRDTVRGYRTGRIDRVLAGEFDLF